VRTRPNVFSVQSCSVFTPVPVLPNRCLLPSPRASPPHRAPHRARRPTITAPPAAAAAASSAAAGRALFDRLAAGVPGGSSPELGAAVMAQQHVWLSVTSESDVLVTGQVGGG
jgi:hypothetical protein